MPGYTPTVWAAGDTVTSAKLNKMEQGIADGYSSGGGLIINITEDETTATMDKTWQEIWNAMESGQSVLVVDSGNDYIRHIYITNIYFETGEITDYVVEANGSSFSAGSASGYPQISFSGDGGGDGGGSIK